MPSLSTPIGELRAHYGVVVVGSGYGASVAAYRMAELARRIGASDSRDGPTKPTFSVCVLERGLEIPTGDYPDTLTKVARQMQVDTARGHIGSPTALFDLRLNHDVSALVGCGLGGGSLINAGVMLRPPADVFADSRWPTGIAEDTLRGYFNRVRGELDVSAVPAETELLKVTQLFESVPRPVEPDTRRRPPIAVSFRTRINAHGVQQKACVLCGDCMTGCNHAAKNTLVTNYLPAAANAGAAIFCRMDVRAIERHPDRWHVHVRVLDRAFRMYGSPELTIQADAVFLGAGTLGSVEILLRSQRRGLSLSSQLGQRFSGNGDVIAFAYNAPEPVNGLGYGSYVPSDAAVGPLIGGMVDERGLASGALIQEGTVPGALTPLLRFLAPVMARVSRRPIDLSADVRFRSFRREVDTALRGARHGALHRTQTFLGMGRDKAAGVMRLSRDRVRISWPKHAEADDPALRLITGRMKDLTRGMKARYLVNPFWSRVFGRRRVTVHPLGGACMADSAEHGVVNADGAVFKHSSGSEVHRGLYVCDGAVVPTALGTNPALTIAALAERIADQAAGCIRTLTAKAATPQSAPERVRPSVPGIHYAERLRGRIVLGKNETSAFTMVLHISAENLPELIREPRAPDFRPCEHEAAVVGVLTAPDLPEGLRQFTVTNGTFNVMVDDWTRVDSKLIKYNLTLTSTNGTTFTLTGQKEINHDTAKSKGLWGVVSSYDFVVREGSPPTDQVGWGTARAGVLDTIRMVASMRITHERAWIDRQILKTRYRWYFVRSLLKVVLRSLEMPVNPLAGAAQVPLPPDIQSGPQITDDKRPANPRFALTPYTLNGSQAPNGPVILAPGFGMSSYAFRLENSLTEYLCRRGYQVWLLDYRASDSLAASLDQFTLDDLAIGNGSTLDGDFPDAIRAIVKENGGKPVKMVAHCVASLTMFMSLLRGRLTEDHLDCVILSQSFACINHPWINRLKAWIHLPQFLRYMRFITVMTPDYDLRSGWRSRLLDRVLRLYPTNEKCSSGVCRRLLLMYGEVIRHDQLDKAMHDRLYQLFDRANMTTFVHLSRMIAKGRIVDSAGKDTYLTPENTKRIRVPITLLQGQGNRLFKPRGGQRTVEWLHRYGGYGSTEKNKEKFRLVPVPGHGHLDTFIGKHAPAVSYPLIAHWLSATGAGATATADGHLESDTLTRMGPSIKWGSNSESVGS
jgi:cholesterol oxidase